jgi:hypothetical protein
MPSNCTRSFCSMMMGREMFITVFGRGHHTIQCVALQSGRGSYRVADSKHQIQKLFLLLLAAVTIVPFDMYLLDDSS